MERDHPEAGRLPRPGDPSLLARNEQQCDDEEDGEKETPFSSQPPASPDRERQAEDSGHANGEQERAKELAAFGKVMAHDLEMTEEGRLAPDDGLQNRQQN